MLSFFVLKSLPSSLLCSLHQPYVTTQRGYSSNHQSNNGLVRISEGMSGAISFELSSGKPKKNTAKGQPGVIAILER